MAGGRKSLFHEMYVWLVIFCGYGLLAFQLKRQPLDIDLWRELAILLLLGILAEWFVVTVPQGSLSLGFAVVFAGFIRFDATAVVIISVLSVLMANSIISRDGTFRSTFFNGAQYAISVIAASEAYLLAGGVSADKITLPNLGPLAVFVLTYFVVNHVLVMLFLWPRARYQMMSVWQSALKWDTLTYLFTTPIAVLMVLIYQYTGNVGLILLFLPLLTLNYVLRLYINLEVANKELSALYEVSRQLGTRLDLTKTLEIILSETQKIIRYHTGIIYLWLEDDGLLVPTAIRSPFADKLKHIDFGLGEGLVGQVAKSAQPKLIYDAKKEHELRTMAGINQFLRSLLVIPLTMEDKLIGVFALGKKEPYGFGLKHVQILSSLGGQAAVVMANAILYKRIEHLVVTDDLTKVYNHRYFYRRIEEEGERFRRYGTPFSLLMLDLDNFKRFNDQYGHRAGDSVLYQLAQAVKGATRNLDIVARYGGEEFAVILPETEAASARLLAERICRSVAETPFDVNLESGPARLTVSVGVSTCPQDSVIVQEIVEYADKAMYHSKHTGKNRVSVWSELPAAGLSADREIAAAGPREKG